MIADSSTFPAFEDMAYKLEEVSQAAERAISDDGSTQERRALAHRIYTQLIDLLTEVEDLIHPEPDEETDDAAE